MKKTVLIYGLISGFIVTALMYMNMPGKGEKMNFENGEMLGYATMIIALSLIFFAIKSYRDKQAGGKITFGKGFLIGLYITLIAGTVYALGWEIYYRSSGGTFMQQYMEYYQQKMHEKGVAPAEIEAKMQEMSTISEYYKNPLVRFVMTLMEILPVGIVISLIAAALLKKKNAEFRMQNEEL